MEVDWVGDTIPVYDAAAGCEIPAKLLRPKDKPAAEGSVKVIETWIFAALRNRKFFSFDELNMAIGEKLKEFNDKPFQKRKGSRSSAFLEEEKDFLMPLSASPYETAVWGAATIQPDYLIFVGGAANIQFHMSLLERKLTSVQQRTVLKSSIITTALPRM